MQTSKFFLRSLIALTFLSTAVAQAEHAAFNASPYYFGGNIGASYLKPSTSGTLFNNDDNADLGLGIFVGYKLSPSVAVQINYNDLGSAGIKSALTEQKVDVGYKVFSADVRKTIWQDNDRWSVFAGAGIDNLNKDSNETAFSEKNNLTLKLLAGADYALKPGLYLRPQIETFSTHAAYVSVGLVKYLGAKDKITTFTSAPAQPISAQPEQEKQVAELKSTFSDITFDTNSARITPKASKILNNAAEVIRQTTQGFEIQAYTDNRGKEAHNLALSQKRAQSIVDYLVAHGVSANRLTAKGYGSANPIANNATEEGRAQNRRATFQLK